LKNRFLDVAGEPPVRLTRVRFGLLDTWASLTDARQMAFLKQAVAPAALG
jgi:predicted Zn-dependent protease with MMP-like domain